MGALRLLSSIMLLGPDLAGPKTVKTSIRLWLGGALLALGFAAPGCVSLDSKVRFSLAAIRPDGLSGPADGLVAVDYEFCVPADAAVLAEVRAIDPTVRISLVSRGRSDRREGQAWCLGHTHQPGWREILHRLASLPYIAEIRRCDWE